MVENVIVDGVVVAVVVVTGTILAAAAVLTHDMISKGLQPLAVDNGVAEMASHQ